MSKHTTGDGRIPERQKKNSKLKRIMSVSGSYGLRNYTVKDLQNLKGKKKLVETLVFTAEEAQAAEIAGIDTLKVRFDPSNPEPVLNIRRAAPNTFMAYSIPLIAAASETEAVKIAYLAMKYGGDAIMCQWSPKFIAAATDAGVPIQGHAGLVPRRSTWTGGLKAVGKTLEEAYWVYEQIKLIEKAGAYAVEVEVIPEKLLKEISKKTTLLTSSIGAGSGGDIQFLFAEDILGNNPPPYPRHSKQYKQLYKFKQKMDQERISGFKDFIKDVKNNKFPAKKHIIECDNEMIKNFLKKIK